MLQNAQPSRGGKRPNNQIDETALFTKGRVLLKMQKEAIHTVTYLFDPTREDPLNDGWVRQEPPSSCLTEA
jgi:hypothetical protein